MAHDNGPGQIVILNGVPRSGKSSIVEAIQETFDGPWMNLGVDTFKEHVTPDRYSPGVGLRPGGKHQDLEPLIGVFFAAMYESIAAHSRLGLNVVVDVVQHSVRTAQPLTVDERAVGRGQVAQPVHALGLLYLGVPARDAHLVQHHLIGYVAAEYCATDQRHRFTVVRPAFHHYQRFFNH